MALKTDTMLFGNVVDLDCHMQDLKLLLRKTEDIEFPHHEVAAEGESLIGDIHPDITRKSFIVTLLIAFDDQLKRICQILQKGLGLRLAWTDLKGTALERCIAYCEKVCDLDPVCSQVSRQQVVGLIEVRNCIVHNDSSIEGFGKPTAVENFARETEGVGIADGYIELEYEGCLRCADIIKQFLEGVYRSGMKRFPS